MSGQKSTKTSAPALPRYKLNNQILISTAALVISIIIALYFFPTCKLPPETSFTYRVHGKNALSKSGPLKDVHGVLERLGYFYNLRDSDWDLFWSSDYPFLPFMKLNFKNLTQNQLVNKYPGSTFITNKMDLATSISQFIPKSYKMPRDGDQLIEYAESSPEAMFIQKDNEHRGIFIKNITQINVEKENSFIQEYVKRPLIIDDRKLDIGVYTILTSVDPLRIYVYKADCIFRFCTKKYYPFDPRNLNSYVISDHNYVPFNEISSLASYYNNHGFGMKDSFNAYIRSKEKDPMIIWQNIDIFIAEIFQQKEHYLITAVKSFPSKLNFFELMRFNFIVTDELQVYVMDANMSPDKRNNNLITLLNDQVIFNTLSLVGLTKPTSLKIRNEAEKEMYVSHKNLAVWAEDCQSELCKFSCGGVCMVCRQCFSNSTQETLTQAYKEHVNRIDCRRVYPPPMVEGKTAIDLLAEIQHLSPNNQLMHLWFQGKCNVDAAWCI